MLIRNLLILLMMFTGPALAEGQLNQGNVTLHVTGLNNDKGVLRIALFNSSASYTEDKNTAQGAFMKDVADIKSGNATYTFQHVPFGEYAIKLFHDEDNSGKFITGMMGIPKVQYAFSNNAHGAFGPASYDKAKFKLNANQLNMEIKMLGK